MNLIFYFNDYGIVKFCNRKIFLDNLILISYYSIGEAVRGEERCGLNKTVPQNRDMSVLRIF